jgi:hypothetical protein
VSQTRQRTWLGANFTRPYKGILDCAYERTSDADKVAIKILKVEGVATTLDHSNGGTMGRDIGGKNNKFDFQKVREGPSINTVTEWKGKKWVDEEDANVTWFHIPKSQKYVNTGGTMVPVEQVVQGAPQYPQFEFHKNAMV